MSIALDIMAAACDINIEAGDWVSRNWQEANMHFIGKSFTAQTWNGQEKIGEIADLSIDAAREICRTHAAMGKIGRVWCQSDDYIEVYCPNGDVRVGTFGETTLV